MSHPVRSFAAALLGALSVLLTLGCSRGPAPARSTDELFEERLELPAVYLTAKTGHRVIAPVEKGVFVDKETGELCWPALACNRPDCPGRASDGEPFLFISPDPQMVAKPDGTVGYDPHQVGKPSPSGTQCPKCWEQRNRASETEAQRQQFIAWSAPYFLPETAKRLEDLEAERKRRLRHDRHREQAGETVSTDGE